MNRFLFYIFIYLNIYTIYFSNIQAQALGLKVLSESNKDIKLIDSIGYQVSHKDFNSLQKEVLDLKNRFIKSGYLETKIISLKNNDSIYVANFFIGDNIKEILIFYNDNDFTKKDLQKVSKKIDSKSFLIPFNKTEDVLNALTAIKVNEGFVFSSIRLDSITKISPQKIRAKLVVEHTEKRILDSFVIKGYENFPKSFLKYYLGMRTNAVFNKEALLLKNRLLNTLPFVSSLKAPEVLFTQDKTQLYFYLTKRKSNVFDGILGFATDESGNKLQFNGYVDLQLVNNLNYGESFLLKYKADGNQQQQFSVQLKMPFVFKTPVGIEMGLEIFKRDSSFVTAQQRIAATYQISPQLKGLIGYQNISSSNLLEETQAVDIIDYNTSSLLAGMSYVQLQDNPFFVEKFKFKIETQFASRKTDSLKEDQVHIKSEIGYIFNLDTKNSIFVQNKTYLLTGSNFFENELFRIGGIESVVGFNENAIDANLFSGMNTAYRYIANEQLFLQTIVDFGYFENKITDIKKKIIGFGFGVGIKSKANLMQLILANGTVENQNIKFSNTKIHFQFIQRF